MTTDTDTNIPEGRHSAPVAALPPSEMLMGLNGFDEIAIAAFFGQKITEMREADAVMTGRALAFVHYRRNGQNDKEAHNSCMLLTMRQVVEFFPPEPKVDDPDPDASSAEGNA